MVQHACTWSGILACLQMSKGILSLLSVKLYFHFSDLLQISAGFESASVHLKLINFLSLVGKISRQSMWVSSNLKVCSLLYLHLMTRGKKPLSKQPGRGAEILQGMQTRFLLPARLHLTDTCPGNGAMGTCLEHRAADGAHLWLGDGAA